MKSLATKQTESIVTPAKQWSLDKERCAGLPTVDPGKDREGSKKIDAFAKWFGHQNDKTCQKQDEDEFQEERRQKRLKNCFDDNYADDN